MVVMPAPDLPSKCLVGYRTGMTTSQPQTDAEFRAEVREWLATALSGEFGALRGTGGPGPEDQGVGGARGRQKHPAAAARAGVGRGGARRGPGAARAPPGG